MAEYNLFMGGLSGNADHRLVPSGSPEIITGYADHQRSRDYAVTRQLDFRPPKPWGGEFGTVALKDYDWYKAKIAASGDLKVDDILNLIVIPKNTRVNYISANLVVPGKVGLTFDVIRRTHVLATDPFDPVALPAPVAGYMSAALMGATPGIYTSTRLIETGGAPNSMPTQSFVSIVIKSVPAAPTYALDGLVLLVQAEVVDWGSGDFNGNV